MPKFDEMYAQLPYAGSPVREHYKSYEHWLSQQSPELMRLRERLETLDASLRAADEP